MRKLVIALFVMALVAAVGGSACGSGGGGGGQGSPAPSVGY
jgi:hypothetical protein